MDRNEKAMPDSSWRTFTLGLTSAMPAHMISMVRDFGLRSSFSYFKGRNKINNNTLTFFVLQKAGGIKSEMHIPRYCRDFKYHSNDS